jgi:hypothetical protein
MNQTKHFCRLSTETELTDEQVITFFDIVQSVVPAKLVTAYADDLGEMVGIEVVAYTASNNQTVYEILLEDDIDLDDGDRISDELAKEFEFDFEFEASTEV